MQDLPSRRILWGILGLVVGIVLISCARKPAAKPAGVAMVGAAPPSGANMRMALDFEEPNPPVVWEDAQAGRTPAGTEPSTQDQAVPLVRSSVHPNTGLWAMQATLAPERDGAILHRFAKPVNLQDYDTVMASVMHSGDAARSGEWRAAVYLKDADGKKVAGDEYPVTSRWRVVPLDLQTAADEGLDISRVSEMGVEFVHASAAMAAAPGTPLDVQTDTWAVQRDSHIYIGQKFGAPKSFYAQRQGTRLEVGMVGQYALTFFQRAGTQRPWLVVREKGRLVVGQAGTGLMLLDQDQYDGLGAAVRKDAYAVTGAGAGSGIQMPGAGWPVSKDTASEWSWECAWVSPIAAIVEVKQTVGPFDKLGQPAAALTWRFMIYQWGQVFVHVEWTKDAGPTGEAAGVPITWALVLDRDAGTLPESAEDIRAKTTADADRLLDAMYPASVREGLTTALPDRMQTRAAVAMIAKSGGAQRNWWHMEADGKRVFGVGISQGNAAGGTGGAGLDCMLLLNSPTAVMQAGSFSQYLVPPKVRVRQGELDRNFPGDWDNDGLVEPYGFQVVRLQNGRTSFMIYPQERPLFYPPYLFTVPAVERDADDLKDSRMLINIDGQQFADPPQFPDGSFLLQMPYVIDRPVQVEGILVRK